jgi:23S rRNA pseudouridine1911/1915/1917 synthase
MAEWIVKEDEGGTRLDTWVAQRARISRKAAKRGLDQGAISVNGQTVVIAKWALKGGDRVVYHAAPGHGARERRIGHRRVDVLLEDRDLIAVLKAHDMTVVPEDGEQEPTVVDQVRAYLKRRHPGARGTYVHALHRLDRGTSGILLLAKSKAGERAIGLFKRHAIHREYCAIVSGRVLGEEGKIDLPLARGEFSRGRRIAPDAHGKRAITRYRVLERYGQATLLHIELHTGRTHQIRVHLASLGHPVLGDRVYGPPEDPLAVPRLMLHAKRLAFRHPTTGEKEDLKSAPPEDMQIIIDTLRTG